MISRNLKPISLPIKIIILILMTAMLGAIMPGKALQATSPVDIDLPHGTAPSINDTAKKSSAVQGGLTITWYSAKRLNYSDTETKNASDGRLINSLLNQAMNVGAKTTVSIDTAKSNQAYNSLDRSVCLGSEPINDLSFDLTKWMPALALPPAKEQRDKYVWGEVTGYIRMPLTGVLLIDEKNGTSADYLFEAMGGSFGGWTKKNYPMECVIYNGYLGKNTFEEGTMIPFRLYIGNLGMDPNKPEQLFSPQLWFESVSEEWHQRAYFGPEVLYSRIGLEQMQQSFFFNPQDFTLRFDTANVNFPVDSYEYGIYSGVLTTSLVHKAGGFQPLHLGINHVTPDSGTVIVRAKDIFGQYIQVGAAALDPPQKVALTRRTSTAAYLSWEAPELEVPKDYKIKYDIYRRYIGELADQVFLATESGGEFGKVGSTTDLTYKDQGLDPNALYEYYVIAGYPTGFSVPSDKVRSDAVDMEGLPYTPKNITVVGKQTGAKVDLTLSWTASYSPPGIKEYVIYRMRTRPPEVYQSREVTDESGRTSYVMGEAKEVIPQEIARTASTNYIDRSLDLGDGCDYYIQAIDNKGAKSRISPQVSIRAVGVIPPTAPGNLQVGDVLRQGENMEFKFPESTQIRNAVLGPEREIVLRWSPSTDNSKVMGYNIYRVQYGNSAVNAKPVSSPVPNQIKLNSKPDGANRGMGSDGSGTSVQTVPVVPGNDRPLLATTKETTFVDKGLEFGSAYEYYVEAVDDDGNKAGVSVYVGTKKSTLVGCTITGGGQTVVPTPVFDYYHTEYTLKVDNAVKSVSLLAAKTDPQAKVTVNGKQAEGDKFGPLALECGENTLLIEVEPRSADSKYIVPETMRYTLKINRANLDNLPVLILPESITLPDGIGSYKAAGRLEVKGDRVWTGTADYGDGSGETSLKVAADGSFSLEHNYFDQGPYKINVTFKYEELGLVKGNLVVTINKPITSSAAAAPIVTTTVLPDSTAGSSYSATLKTEGDKPVKWSIDSGSLPEGLSLDEKTGVISGTPTSTGAFTFTIKATTVENNK